ncbi:hypothetical protein Tco_1532138 [Tanacetum coccineum]
MNSYRNLYLAKYYDDLRSSPEFVLNSRSVAYFASLMRRTLMLRGRTPPHDIIEDIAETIISTIPRQRSETQPTEKDSSSATTTAEPRPTSAKVIHIHFLMANLTLLEELGDAASSTALPDRLRVWFQQDLVKEEGFANTMSRFRLDLAEKIVRCRKMIRELEGLGPCGVALDCVIRLKNTQMRDLEKLCLFYWWLIRAHVFFKPRGTLLIWTTVKGVEWKLLLGSW